MSDATIPRRWARALIGTLEESAKGDHALLARVEGELSALAAHFTKGSELRNAMYNPAVSSAQRAEVLGAIADAGKFHDVTRRFLGLLVEKDRVRYLEGIARAFRAEVDERLARVRAVITVAKKLDDKAVSDVTAALKRRVGKDVIAEIEVDPSVLSGLKAQIGGLVYDGTLRSQLDRLRSQLV